MIWSRNKQGPVPEKFAPVTELVDAADLVPYISGAKKTIVFFEMTGCPYCVPYRSRFADLARERSDLSFLRVKLDDPGNGLWEIFNILAVPTVIAFERGEIVARADSILAFGLSKKKWLEFCARFG